MTALLQISEPGQPAAAAGDRIAVGIDLGTTNSLVAVVRNGKAECLLDPSGRALLPSAVRYLPDGGRQIGHEALAAQLHDPENTVVSVKRLMGRSVRDIGNAIQLPYRLLDGVGEGEFADGTLVALQIATIAGPKTAVEVSAEILATLRQRAEDALDADVYGAVITVPAYFDDAQRQATKDAARLAGLRVLRLLNEPTAAAVAYGLDSGSQGVYVVYDLGGGTFDVSVLRLEHGVFQVLATGGDSALGGDDYDAALGDWVAAHHGLDVATPAARAAMRQAARACKEALSAIKNVAFRVEWAGEKHVFDINIEDFERATEALAARTLSAVRKVLRDADMAVGDIDGVVLVGGATRMPQIRRAVAAFFHREPLLDLDPDQVVALGAARQAQQLAGNDGADDLLLLDVIPLSLGIETMGGLVERVIPRNETIPTTKAQDFTTYQDGQTALALHVVQGERDMVADCRSLARFELRGIPPMAAGAARIRVTFTVDADGLLTVSATETGSGVSATIDVRPTYGLSDEAIARMLREGFDTAAADMAARAAAEAGVDARRLLQATATALVADGDLLDAEEAWSVQDRTADVHAALEAGDTAALTAATEALARATNTLAERRMNRSIRGALAGRKVEALD